MALVAALKYLSNYSVSLSLNGFNILKETISMEVGDLVRWVMVGEIGILLNPNDEVCEVYCFLNKRIFIAYKRDLEVINEGG